ncbi:PREDICTED: vacuolar protein sorting-associated protein 37D, partial [Tauraco erythrolophus]|uniref:vacuolar protein sorting-associated protein 37D n=1 Tax=Tauraco erythrolophus TaxID=121530 RepID=UPI000523DAE4
FQSLQLEREMCLASNCTLARGNLDLDGKASLAIKYQELREIRESCWDKQQRLEEYLEKWSPQSALGHLQAKLDASEAESEKLQELLQKDQVGRDPAGPMGHPGALASPAPARLAPLRSGVAPKAFDLSYGFVPAFLIPSEAAVPFAMPAAPPRHHLPALGHQPAASEIPSPGSPLHLIGHIPLLSPQPFRRQQWPRHQKQKPPHR